MKYVMLVFFAVLITVAVISLDVYYVVGKLMVRQFGDANLGPIVTDASVLLGAHLIVYFFIVIICAVFFSHKLAGPIFRLEQVAEMVAKGDLSVRVSLRQGDELFETAEYINHMIESLRERVLRDRNLCARVTGQLEDISKKLKGGKMTVKQAHEALEEILRQVQHVASDFKL